MLSGLMRKSIFIAAFGAGALLAGCAWALEPGEFALTAYDKDGAVADEILVGLESNAEFNGSHFACNDAPDTTYYNSEEGGKKMSLDWYAKRYKMVVETVNDAGERVPVCEFKW